MPRRRKWQPTPVFLPGESMDRRVQQVTVHMVTKSRTRLSNMLDDIPNTLTSILRPLFPVTFSFALPQYHIAIQNHNGNSPEPHHI